MTQSALVVDDDPASRLIYQQILTNLGFAVVSAGDGAAALEELQRNHFDIIFLDLLLPHVSGTELLEYVHNASHLADTPVIVVSAHSRYANTVRLRPRDRFLLKPVLTQTIREVTRGVLSSSTTNHT